MSDNFTLEPDNLITGETSVQSECKFKRRKLTRDEVLSRQREKPMACVESRTSSRYAQPLVRQVVVKLQELCRAVLVIDTFRKQEINPKEVSLNIKQDLKECAKSSVVTSTVLRENIKMTHKTICDTLALDSDVNTAIPYLRSSEVHALAEVGGSDNVERVKKSKELPVSKNQSCEKHHISLNHINSINTVNSYEDIKENHQFDIKDINMSVNDTTNNCRTQTVDYFTSIQHKTENSTTYKKDSSATSNDHTACAMDEEEDNKIINNNNVSKSGIILNNFFNSRHEYQNHFNCKKLKRINVDSSNVTNQSFATTIDENVLDRISSNGISFLTDEDTLSCHEDNSIKLSDPQLRVGKRKRISDNFTSLADEVSNSSVLSGNVEGEMVPTLKNVHLEGEVVYSTRNSEIMPSRDTNSLPLQDTLSCHGDNSIKLSDPQLRVGKRKRISDNFTSLADEVSNSSVLSGSVEGEMVPTLKNVHLEGEVVYSTRNSEIMPSRDTNSLPLQDTSSCHGDNSIKLSDPQLRVGKRKCISDNFTSLADEVSNSSVLSGSVEGEMVPTLKNVHLEGEVVYSTRNSEIMPSRDTNSLPLQDVFNTESTRRFSYCTAPRFTEVDVQRCITPTNPCSSRLLPISNSERIGSYLEPKAKELSNAEMPVNYSQDRSAGIEDPFVMDYTPMQNMSLRTNNSNNVTLPTKCVEKLYQERKMLQSPVQIPYSNVSISSAATRVLPTGTALENDSLETQEEELFRRLEESLVKTENLKYQEEELLKRIERSLTETESLKCREEELLKKIERSLTKAESLKSREEELLRRIEVSLAQTETVKPQDEEMLIRIKASLTDTKYDVDSKFKLELQPTYNQDLDYSLPLKKRKKRLRSVLYDEDRELKLQSESFPSFSSRQMISIAELEEHAMFGKLQQHINFPSFPVRPMISIAELQARTKFGNVQLHESQSSTSTAKVSKYPHYNKSDICYDLLHPRDIILEQTFVGPCGQSVVTEDERVFPICKVEETTDRYRYGCCDNTYDCTVSQLRSKSYGEQHRKGVVPLSNTSHCEYQDGMLKRMETMLMNSNSVEDSKAHIKLLEEAGAEESLDSKVETDFNRNINMYATSEKSAPDIYTSDIDTKDNIELLGRIETTLTESKCNNFENYTALQKISNISLGSINSTEFNVCPDVHEKSEILIEEPRHIKTEYNPEDRSECCDGIFHSLADFKYTSEVESQESVKSSKCAKMDVDSNDNVEMCKNAVNTVTDSKCDVDDQDIKNKIPDINTKYNRIETETKDNIQLLERSDVSLKES